MSGVYDPLAQRAAEADSPASPTYDPLSTVAAGGTLPSEPQNGPSFLQENVERPLGLAGRAVATGAAALPLMAMDTGVAARNIIGDWGRKELGWRPTPDYELPSQEFQDALTQAGFPVPKNPIEKGTSFVESLLSGSAMPVPEAGGDVPNNFTSPQEALTARRLQSVRNGMDAGYRIPPATSNPTALNRGIETVAGKLATQQAASLANQEVTNRLAAEALGLDPSVPVTEEALHAVRESAANDYNAIGNAGAIKLDQPFKDSIDSIVGNFNKTAEEVPSLANKDLAPVAKDLKGKESLSGKAVLGAIRGLRDKADAAFRAGEGGTGSAYKQMASALEGAVDRDLSSRGEEYSGMVKAFRSARRQIAISHSIENALNPGTGNVQAAKLAAALRRGEPLSGPLKTIAEFANSAPKAVQEPLTSPVSHLNIVGEILGAMGGALAHGPVGAGAGAALYPAARMGAKWFAMNPGQAWALPEEGSAEAPALLRGAPAAYAASREGNGQ